MMNRKNSLRKLAATALGSFAIAAALTAGMTAASHQPDARHAVQHVATCTPIQGGFVASHGPHGIEWTLTRGTCGA